MKAITCKNRYCFTKFLVCHALPQLNATRAFFLRGRAPGGCHRRSRASTPWARGTPKAHVFDMLIRQLVQETRWRRVILGATQPPRLGVVLRPAMPFLVHEAEAALRLSVPLPRGEASGEMVIGGTSANGDAGDADEALGNEPLEPEQEACISLEFDGIDDHVEVGVADNLLGIEREVTLTARIADTPLWADLDPDRYGQIIGNLVGNALRFADREVVVTLWSAEGGAHLSVGDDGPGIAEADLPHVFERLYVAEHSPAVQESGSGLGLAIVRDLTERMGGSVTARRSSLGGAEFVVSFAPAPPPTP